MEPLQSHDDSLNFTMKKSIVFLATLLSINGCADIYQPLEILPSQLKIIPKIFTVEGKVKETQPADEIKNKPRLVTTDQATAKLDTYPTVAKGEPPKKANPLNISIPREITPQENQDIELKVKPAEIDTTSSPEAAEVSELKPAPKIDDIAIIELNNHHWQISKIVMSSNFIANKNQWIFSFNKTGQYKAFGACNFLMGKFNAFNDGTFRLGKLETTLNDCPESKEKEVMVFNMLLMADSFAIRDGVLVLKSAQKVMMEFKYSDQNINFNMAQKSYIKKDKKTSKAKKSLKDRKASKEKNTKKASKKKLQKNGISKAIKPFNQKHSDSSHKKVK